jgi:hypothetical protein
MGDLLFTFQVARFIGVRGRAPFDRPVRTIAAHPIAAAERVTGIRLYLIGEPDNLLAEVSYANLDGEEERLVLYRGPLDQSQVRC